MSAAGSVMGSWNPVPELQPVPHAASWIPAESYSATEPKPPPPAAVHEILSPAVPENVADAFCPGLTIWKLASVPPQQVGVIWLVTSGGTA